MKPDALERCFFYGLFMDADLLRAKNLNPDNVNRACVRGFGLRIGTRATLEPSASGCAWGTIMSLSSAELKMLYSDESVSEYRPVAMEATDEQGNQVRVVSYILPMEKVSGSNSDYARSLAVVAMKAGLPKPYIDEIRGWI